MERVNYICKTEDDGAEVLTLLRRELHISTNLLRQLKVTENGILLDDVRVTVRHTGWRRWRDRWTLSMRTTI